MPLGPQGPTSAAGKVSGRRWSGWLGEGHSRRSAPKPWPCCSTETRSRVGSWVLGGAVGSCLGEGQAPTLSFPLWLATTNLGFDLELLTRVSELPFSGPILGESGQVWRTEARRCLPPGHSPARAGLAPAATASAEPGPAHTLVELECFCGFSESVGSGPFFCSFDARILVEALCCAQKTRWRTVLPQHFGGFVL